MNDAPSTLLAFQARFATEQACEDFLFRWRWPDGFRCPDCSGPRGTRLRGRREWQCPDCGRQISITAGTALHRSKLSLRVWFWAMFLVARHKKSISALQLQADLGLGSYRTAWLLLHKIRSVLSESTDFPLRGVVEIDESLVGRVDKGAIRGRGSDRAMVVAAVERRPDGRLGSARAEVVPQADAETLVPFVKRSVAPGARVETDGWRAYLTLRDEGYSHRRTISVYGRKTLRPVLDAAHLFFSNLKTWIRGRFHGVSPKYASAYLGEFTYRFNRRRSPPEILGWLARRLMNHPARTLDQIRGAEASA